MVLTLVSLLRAVVRAERVTRDTIYGALNAYLLTLVWGLVISGAANDAPNVEALVIIP